MTFQPFLTQTITINASGTGKALSSLQIAMYWPSPADLEYSLPPLWTIQSHLVGLSESKSTSISIHGYVDLRRSVILCGKYSSIDLSSIDSNGIRSPCTWLPNTEPTTMMLVFSCSHCTIASSVDPEEDRE